MNRPRRTVDLTPDRLVWLDALDLPTPSHAMCAPVEVDVTLPRQMIAAEEARTGDGLSSTGFLVSRLARAVDANKVGHDVDGAPATRFVRRLIALIDSGDGLPMAKVAS